MKWPVIIVTGSGDEATAITLRLVRSGFKVILVTQAKPIDLHFHRNFTRLVYAGQGQIEGVQALTFSQALLQDLISPEKSVLDFISFALANRQVPIVFLDDLKRGQIIRAQYLVKLSASIFEPLSLHLAEETKIIGIEPEEDVALWIASQGAQLGQVQYPFLEEKTIQIVHPRPSPRKIIEAPLEGVFTASKEVSDRVFEREEIGKLNEIPILSPYNGVITGLINSGVLVSPHSPLVEVTTGRVEADARQLPAEAFALAGGVLEAILYDWKNAQEEA